MSAQLQEFLSSILTRRTVKINILTFLCSLAFLGLSGVFDPFAGAPAIGDAVCFSIVSAGIVEAKKKVFKSKSSMDALVKKKNEKWLKHTERGGEVHVESVPNIKAMCEPHDTRYIITELSSEYASGACDQPCGGMCDSATDTRRCGIYRPLACSRFV